MRSLRTSLMGAVLALTGVVVGCNDAVNQTCPAAVGVFLSSYRQIDGSCPETFQGQRVAIAKDDRGTITTYESRLADTVTTQIILKGCTIALHQTIEAGGQTLSDIQGNLQVHSDVELAGTLMRTVRNPDGSIGCHGVYDARFRRQDAVDGGAALAGQQ